MCLVEACLSVAYATISKLNHKHEEALSMKCRPKLINIITLFAEITRNMAIMIILRTEIGLNLLLT